MKEEWIALEDIGFKVRFKEDYIEVTRKYTLFDWLRLAIIILFTCFLVASILFYTYTFGMLMMFGFLTAALVYLQLRISFFKLKFAPNIYEITEFNYEYDKSQVPLTNVKDFIIGKGPFLAEIHIYALSTENEMFKLLTTNSKFTMASEVLVNLKNKLKENL